MMSAIRTLVSCLLVFFASFTPAFSQDGNYVVNNYVIDPGKVDDPFFEIIQDQQGYMLVGNRNGLLRYDGMRWERIETPGTVFCLATDQEGRILAAGKGGLGFVTPNEQNELTYYSVSDAWGGVEDVFAVELIGERGYALTSSVLYEFELPSGRLVREIPSNAAYVFQNLVQNESQVFVLQSSGELFNVEGEELIAETPGNLPPDILFIECSENNTCLVATNRNRLFLLREGKAAAFMIRDKSEPIEPNITTGKWLSDSLIVLGTLTEGVLFVSIENGQVMNRVNFSNGISDNEITCLGSDVDGGLWIGTAGGLDRIATRLPVRSYHNYEGLEGEIRKIFVDSGKLYLATTTGVYYLDSVPAYKEVVYYEEQEGVRSVEPRGVLRFLKRKKEETFTRRTRKVTKELIGVDYRYVRIEAIETEASHILKVGQKIICGGLAGVFELEDSRARMIIEEPVRSVLSIGEEGSLLVNLLNNELVLLRQSGDEWQRQDVLEGFNTPVYDLLQESDGSVWLSSVDAVYRLYFSDNRVSEIQDYEISNPFYDRTLTFRYKGATYFMNPSGFYTYDEGSDSLSVDSALFKDPGLAQNYFKDQNGSIWLMSNGQWYRIRDERIEMDSVMNLFGNIRFINGLEGYYWIGTKHNDLYRFNSERRSELRSRHGLMLKQVVAPSGRLNPTHVIQVDEGKSSLTFEFVQPDYSGFYGINYRYRLKGMEDNWSDWSEENRIRFPFLPVGDYEITVQTRDIFGQVNESDPVQFSVVPPYWKQTWFYGLEILIFALLLYLNIRYRKKGRNRVVSRLLAFMTLILTVEFIQNVGETFLETDSSPVIDFFIQVSIAFAILPFERVLRKFVLKEDLIDSSKTDRNPK